MPKKQLFYLDHIIIIDELRWRLLQAIQMMNKMVSYDLFIFNFLLILMIGLIYIYFN